MKSKFSLYNFLLGLCSKGFKPFSRHRNTISTIAKDEARKTDSSLLKACLKTAELERRKATRKMVLAGMFFLNMTEEQALFTTINGKTLADFLTHEEDRKLFELE